MIVWFYVQAAIKLLLFVVIKVLIFVVEAAFSIQLAFSLKFSRLKVLYIGPWLLFFSSSRCWHLASQLPVDRDSAVPIYTHYIYILHHCPAGGFISLCVTLWALNITCYWLPSPSPVGNCTTVRYRNLTLLTNVHTFLPPINHTLGASFWLCSISHGSDNRVLFRLRTCKFFKGYPPNIHVSRLFPS